MARTFSAFSRTSSADIRTPSVCWFRQRYFGSRVMTFSSVKSASQNVFDAMNLNPHVAGRKTHNFSDRRRIHVFQVKKHQFAIKRPEATDQLKQPFESQSFLRIPLVVALIRH